ncbi:MAG: hypothetical protein LJE62_14820 [Silicimonas sp.]|nr:hypothetical protein [Silicimonas sp.]
MPAVSDAEKALSAIRDSGFEVNDHWEAAHQIAQAHEGVPLFDAIHALLHRIEGDHGNAAYWDRRAGSQLGGEGHAYELAALRSRAGLD